MKNKKLISYILIILVIISAVFWIRGKRKDNSVANVKTALSEVGQIKSYLSTTATIKSQNSKEYYGTQGKIKKINVKVGDKVKKGDTLLTYETQDLTLTVKQAQIQYDNAILQKEDLYNQSKIIKEKISDMDRQISILEKSTNQIDKAKLETLKQQKSSITPISDEKLKQTDNAVNLAKISLDMAKQNLSKNQSSIIAENEGVVTALNAVEGAASNGMQPVVVVQDIENLKAIVSLGKYDANKVKVGQEVTIKGGEKIYKGKVTFIDPAAKKISSIAGNDTTLGVEVAILEKAPELKIDFDVDIDILIGEVDNTLKVPVESVKFEKGNKNLVYVLENGIAKEKSVEIGLQSDTYMEIKKGITKGEKVILNPSTSIKDGTKAKESVGGEDNVKGK